MYPHSGFERHTILISDEGFALANPDPNRIDFGSPELVAHDITEHDFRREEPTFAEEIRAFGALYFSRYTGSQFMSLGHELAMNVEQAAEWDLSNYVLPTHVKLLDPTYASEMDVAYDFADDLLYHFNLLLKEEDIEEINSDREVIATLFMNGHIRSDKRFGCAALANGSYQAIIDAFREIPEHQHLIWGTGIGMDPEKLCELRLWPHQGMASIHLDQQFKYLQSEAIDPSLNERTHGLISEALSP